MSITVHCLVKNEENFIWFAINSVIDYVDEIMVWDAGSNDKTVDIIHSIKVPKLKFKEVGLADSIRIPKLRQEMLEETDADWIFILDGDEIWSEEGIKNCKLKIVDSRYDVIVVPNYMLIGDIYHYQEEKAGRYKIGTRTGHYNIRAFRKTFGLHVEGIYPNEAYINGDGVKLQNLPEDKILFLDQKYLHASFLPRSSKDNKKIKYEIGEEFPKDFYYPEVFFRPRSSIIPSPWRSMNSTYKLNSLWQTPLKKIKRRML